MPVQWTTRQGKAPDQSGAFSNAGAGAGDPLATARLWPNRSLPRGGFVIVIALLSGLITLPVLPLIGTPVLWGLLPFLVGAVWLLWHFLMRSYRDGDILEELSLWSDQVTLARHDPGIDDPRMWSANPHWVSVHMRETGGPVSHYVTLRGAGREVEIGAFLSPDERKALYAMLRQQLGRAS